MPSFASVVFRGRRSLLEFAPTMGSARGPSARYRALTLRTSVLDPKDVAVGSGASGESFDLDPREYPGCYRLQRESEVDRLQAVLLKGDP